MGSFRYRRLVCDRDRVVGVLGVPFGDEFIAGLADVLAVDDRAAEDARDVEPVTEGGIGAILNIERAIERDGGRPGAKTFHLDGAAGAAIFDELIAQFLDVLIQRAFHNAGGA